jgi:alkanesulfonate monooxygenase SsuD/methylene tetrahydromethanopterin reductase-like flavin-dependent oxidoreductase (luciferase family)
MDPVRFAVNVPNFGAFADPRIVADLARRAEQAGWDALFVWDHVTWVKSPPRVIADPWILLTAAALATSRIRLGTMITPVPRRRVSKLAREVTTLDRLTGGRMTLGVGLGAPVEHEYGSFGEPTDRKQLAVRLDEGLFILKGLWSGEPVTFHGQQLVVDDVTFLPVPVQRPRVPIWVAGEWPAKAPMRRAARWDGAVPLLYADGRGNPPRASAAMVREVSAFLTECREREGLAGEPFDLSLWGSSAPESAADTIGPLAEAGATWWQESVRADQSGSAEPIIARVEYGPV